MPMSRALNFLVRRVASLPVNSPNPAILSSPQLSLSSSPFYRVRFSSQTHSSPHSPASSADAESSPASSSNNDLPADVSTEELKQRIDKYLQGDMEAIPSIFEAILARKLTENHEDTDDEIMEEFRSKAPHNDKDELFDSDDESDDVL